MMAVAEAARNITCAGGRPLAVTDGLNFGNPMKPENYWQFEKCIEGLSAACRALDTPIISGNVSFYNESPKGAVDPTPMVGMVGLIKDADKYVTQDFKNENDLIVLLGENTGDLSGSEYLYLVHKQKKGNPHEPRIQIAQGWFHSSGTAGGHRHHRNSCSLLVARHYHGPGSGQACSMHEQHPAGRPGGDQL